MKSQNIANIVEKSFIPDITEKLTDYALDLPQRIPGGKWKLTIIKGDAWVFMTHQNIVLHPTTRA